MPICLQVLMICKFVYISVQLFVYICFIGVHEQSYIAHAIEYAAGWNDAENLTQSQALALGAGIFFLLFVVTSLFTIFVYFLGTQLQSLMTMTFFALIMIIF